MQFKKLGKSDLEISPIGLGCMGMSEFYGPTDEGDSIRTLHRALELGINFLDTADQYGSGANEALLEKALIGKRSLLFTSCRHESTYRRYCRCNVSIG